MKKLVLIAALLNGGLASAYSEGGGDSAASSAESSASAQGEEQQVVLIEAWRRDRALDAFLRGDFATAEVEFQKNVRCIRRGELALDGSLRQGALELDRGSFLGAGHAPHIHNLPLRPEQIAERTCHSKEWQLYMIGLSQIQLGRFAEAKKSLSTAAWMSKEDLLFDAHYRVGLLELLEGDVDSANRRLNRLVRMQRSCEARGASCEVGPDLEAATNYLKHAVGAARNGVVR
jgi:hypothetical protein